MSRGDFQVVTIGEIAGDTRDGLPLTPVVLEGGMPQDRIGGIGSGIAYTGVGDRYLFVTDRGPSARSSYVPRVYVIEVPTGEKGRTAMRVQAVKPLTNEQGATFIGRSDALGSGSTSDDLRLDPEAIRPSGAGTFFVADEYGPSIYEFDADGKRLRSFTLPKKFQVTHRAATKSEELPPFNEHGRVPQSGFEGLAITPDGKKLYALMQEPLIQDHALKASGAPHGVNCRLLELDLSSGATRELVYELDGRKNGTNEILAINDHEFLVAEREREGPKRRTFQKIFKIDIRQASDVSDLERLPAKALPPGVRAVRKTLFLDMRAPELALHEQDCPEKMEGLAFGPDLPDGRRLLLVGCDNDFNADRSSKVVAVAVRRSLLSNYEPQALYAKSASFDGGRGVAILASTTLACTDLDRSSARLKLASATLSRIEASSCECRDVNGDGIADLACRPSFGSTTVGTAHVTASVEAMTTSGSPVLSQ